MCYLLVLIEDGESDDSLLEHFVERAFGIDWESEGLVEDRVAPFARAAK